MYFKLAYFVHATMCAYLLLSIEALLQAQGKHPKSPVQPLDTIVNEPDHFSEQLMKTKAAISDKDTVSFKVHRATILQQLNVLYQRFVAADRVLSHYSTEPHKFINRNEKLSISLSLPVSQNRMAQKSESAHIMVVWDRKPSQIRCWYSVLAILSNDDLRTLDVTKASAILENNLYFANGTDFTKLFYTFHRGVSDHTRQVQRTGKELFTFDIDLPGFDRGCDTFIGLENVNTTRT